MTSRRGDAHRRAAALLTPALVMLAATGAAHAAGRTVLVSGFEYEPSPVTVDVGDTVTWRNESIASHTATADGGAFDSGTIRGGQSFSFRFTAAGEYRYSCSIHPQMHGEVIVKGAGGEGPMNMPSMPERAPQPEAPQPGGAGSGPVGISVRLSRMHMAHRSVTAVAIRVSRPGARILLELYSREHFSWRQVGHARAGSTGAALLHLSSRVHLPLRVVVPGRPGEAASISTVLHS